MTRLTMAVSNLLPLNPMKKDIPTRECLTVGKTRHGATCAIYGHEVIEPNTEPPVIVGWRFFRYDGIGQGEGEKGVQVPVRSRYAAEEVAKAMMYAYGEGHESGLFTGENRERKKIGDAMSLIFSPIVEAIQAATEKR